MFEQGLLQAEQRVREMNRVTRQYTEQGNRFMQQNMQNIRNNQTRFEQVRPNNNTYGNDRNGIPRQQNQQNRQAMQALQAAQTIQREPPVQNVTGQSRTAERAQAASLSFLSDLNLDGEKLMIILIMYLLIKEKADIKLILALGYLLL